MKSSDALFVAIFLVVGGFAYFHITGAVKAPAAPAGAWRIEITGTPGSAFSGTYAAHAADGAAVSQSVEGTAPATYVIPTAASVSAIFQKQAQDGSNLTVTIRRPGGPAKSATTTAEYGTASVFAR
jgi:hypothetical protein